MKKGMRTKTFTFLGETVPCLQEPPTAICCLQTCRVSSVAPVSRWKAGMRDEQPVCKWSSGAGGCNFEIRATTGLNVSTVLVRLRFDGVNYHVCRNHSVQGSTFRNWIWRCAETHCERQCFVCSARRALSISRSKLEQLRCRKRRIVRFNLRLTCTSAFPGPLVTWSACRQNAGVRAAAAFLTCGAPRRLAVCRTMESTSLYQAAEVGDVSDVCHSLLSPKPLLCRVFVTSKENGHLQSSSDEALCFAVTHASSVDSLTAATLLRSPRPSSARSTNLHRTKSAAERLLQSSYGNLSQDPDEIKKIQREINQYVLNYDCVIWKSA